MPSISSSSGGSHKFNLSSKILTRNVTVLWLFLTSEEDYVPSPVYISMCVFKTDGLVKPLPHVPQL